MEDVGKAQGGKKNAGLIERGAEGSGVRGKIQTTDRD